ncbi:MAG: DUF2917 domain-containing protein [Hydrogenophaga sp.]|nr:DUF2917 domain-containing protein [Hydrogenophaga sp.]
MRRAAAAPIFPASDDLPAKELAPHRALTLHAAQPRQLHIVQGRVWLTLDRGGPHGDHFLAAGDTLHLPAGTRAVLEGYPAQPVRWVCSAAEVAQPAPGRFAREVAQPARDLGQALLKATLASGRLLRGVLGYGDWLLPGRGRALSPQESLRS